jgi:hypothetical protein
MKLTTEQVINDIRRPNTQRGDDIYNKEEYNNNKGKYIANESIPLSSSGRTSSSESVEAVPQGSPEPRETRSGIDSLPPPITQDLVKRAYITFFKNPKRPSLSVRLNLADDTNAHFIASLQPKSNLTSYLRHTRDKELSRTVFTQVRKYSKNTFGVNPQQGKFHENNYGKTDKLQPVNIEPNCYGAVAYDPQEKIYKAWLMIYDFGLEWVDLDDSNLTEKQKQSSVRGSHLWINPKYDKRQRPLTWAEKRRLSK